MTDSLSVLWMILFLLAAGAAAFLFWQLRQQKGGLSPSDQARLHGYDEVKAERDMERQRANELEKRLAGETASAAARDEAHKVARAELEKTFESLAQRALGASQQNFLTLAKETFEKHQQVAAGGVKELVAPVQEQFVKLSETIARIEAARTADKSALGEQMRQIGEAMSQTQAVTGKLANALRAGPKTRGRWGEETLKNVLELSGLSQRIDFFAEQTVLDGDGSRLRPDVTISLPGGRSIAVDSKVALSGYLDALDATDETTRDVLLKKHAQELRTHMKLLAGKEYWRHLPAAVDFVVMFVPGDNFLAAAFEHDQTLHQDGFASKVIIVGPSNLFALAKTIAFGWRQEEIQKNADEIARLGRELYSRLEPFSRHLVSLGNALGNSVNQYNNVIGSFDTKLLVTARKFKELGAAEGDAPAEPKVIEHAPRVTASQTELDFGMGATPARLKRNG